jgi:uncharacterized membrane protein YGL010W
MVPAVSESLKNSYQRRRYFLSPREQAISFIEMNRLETYFNDYASYHRTSGNKVCHSIGIPLIAITLLGLLGHVVLLPHDEGASLLQGDLGVALLVIATCWYLTLEWKLALPFGLFALGLYFIGRTLPLPTLWGLFVLGWFFQGFGHYHYEKKSPAFFKNLEHILVGPLWIFARLIGYPVAIPSDTPDETAS